MAAKRFEGTDKYVATDDLRIAVNAAIALERPLLIKGEPGTGKTELAFQVADALKAPLITWHVKSTTKAQQGLYEYDAVTCASRTSRTTSRKASCGTRSKCPRVRSC
jgi:MoxR-like ATPase